MSNVRKLNSVEARNELVFWMVAGPILLILLFLTGIAILFFTPIFFIYSLIAVLLFFRTLNTGYLVKSMFFFFLTVFTLFLFFIPPSLFTVVTGVLSALMLIWLIVLVLIRDLKWRNLHLFEMDAIPVDDVKEGYSMRPMPTGKLIYSWEELLGFAGFIRRKLIAVVYFEKDKVIFGLNNSIFKMITFGRVDLNGTWIAFDRSGNVTVHISRADYDQFSELYAFDQLCGSLGNVFSEFFTLHQQGRGQDITKRLDFIRL